MAAAVAAGGLLAATSRAADAATPRGALHRRFLERAKEKLGLTDDQVARIQTALMADKEILKDLLTRLYDARTGLRGAIQSPEASEALVRAASAKVAAAEADLAVERLKLHGKIYPILTPEQRKKVNEFQSRIDNAADGIISHIGEALEE